MATVQREHIALIGFMGCGKSTVGERLAERLGYRFVDTDLLVEEMAGATIPQIFARDGEEAFRDFETAALRIAVAGPPAVIATGGGLVGRAENWDLLERCCVTVWLRLPFAVLAERLRASTDRPLLQGDPGLARASALYRRRIPLYARACTWVDAGLPPDVVSERIAEWFMTLDRGAACDEVTIDGAD